MAASLDDYRRILEAYRKTPGSHTQAAREAGVAYNTARKAWDKGVANQPPISEVVTADDYEAKARLAEHTLSGLDIDITEKAKIQAEVQVDRMKLAREHGIQVKMAESQLVQTLRDMSIEMSATTKELWSELKHGDSWTRITSVIRDGEDPRTNKVYSAKELVGLMTQIAQIEKVRAETIRIAVDL